jgi:hypothetical protein
MDDAYPSEQDDARQLIDSCADCAALAADIRQLASATSQLPAPKRTRDFTITAEQADKLRGSGLSRWLRGLSTPGWGALRPVAGAALSIGIVMMVVGATLPHANTAAPEDSNGSAPVAALSTPGRVTAPEPAATPAPQVGGASSDKSQTPEIAVPAATTVPPEMETMASPTERQDQPPDLAVGLDTPTQAPGSEYLNGAYEAPSAQPGVSAQGSNTTAIRDANTTNNLLIYGGLAIALISAALLGLAWFARRRFTDPLLR